MLNVFVKWVDAFNLACAPGTYNANCSDECPDGFYGLFCAEKCSCEKYCDKVKGCLNSGTQYVGFLCFLN